IMWLLLLSSLVTHAQAAGTCGGKFSQADRDVILKAHNTLRATIASGKYTAQGKTFPSASNMQAMEWDCDVENSAQSWANGCLYEHSKKNATGENMYQYWSWQAVQVNLSVVPQKGCDSWSTEFQQRGLNSTTLTVQQFLAGIGHATQMAWAASTKLGCGVSLCGEGGK
ncbi:hypothetical protein PFISCL1PPCAC_13222, partial [Pristionchus fissidentatus]